ncbi:MAG: phosphate ABC transporter substrate-binding protein [Acidobacteriota bacterium]
MTLFSKTLAPLTRQSAPLLAMALLLAAVGGCRAPSGPGGGGGASVRLTLTGSSTVAPLAAEIAKRFEAEHPGVRVDVQTGGSSRGIRDARSGAADLGMASRALQDEELPGVAVHTIAWDGVAFVVHRENPVAELSREQLMAIYTGAADNWRQVGGRDAPILVSNRAEGRSELDLMTDFLGLEVTEVEADVIDGETQQTIKTVTTHENAITYTSLGAAQHAAESGEALRLLPLGGVTATAEAVQSGDFPLARPLILIAPDDADSWAERFLAYAGSEAVDDLTLGLGFVPPRRAAPRERAAGGP